MPRVLAGVAAETKMAASKCRCRWRGGLGGTGNLRAVLGLRCGRAVVEAMGSVLEGDAEVTRGLLQGRGGTRGLEVTGRSHLQG